MKKLLYLLFAVALVGCAKDDLEVSSGNSETLSFIISDDLSTRADTDKTAWAVDDLLAIFEGTTETSKQYKVASLTADGKATLTPATTSDGFLNDGTYDDVTFTAYYPYEADRTLSDYQAQEDDADVLYSTGEVASGTVTFETFTHENTHITFNFVAGREYADGFEYIDIELRSGSAPLWKHTISDLGGATSASYSLYCPALESLSGVVLYMVANGDLDAYYAVDLGAIDGITSWVAGKHYTYSGLYIGTSSSN
ncbi:MAG: fimbrillin family protein [Rikenellaceae bacterium]